MNHTVERSVYLGYRIVLTPHVILVSTSDGYPVGDAQSMSSARRLVRRHRASSRVPA